MNIETTKANQNWIVQFLQYAIYKIVLNQFVLNDMTSYDIYFFSTNGHRQFLCAVFIIKFKCSIELMQF